MVHKRCVRGCWSFRKREKVSTLGVPPTLNVFTNVLFDDLNVEILPTNLDEAPFNSFTSMKLEVHDADDGGRKMSLPRIPITTKKTYVDAVNEYCKELFLRK